MALRGGTVHSGPSTGSRSDPMTRRILLTGASGFVGPHLARLLLDRGYGVSALRRGEAALPEGVEPIQGDLEDPDSLAALPRRWDGVVHLAAVSIPGLFTSAAPVLRNVAMALNLLDHLQDSQVLLVSSCHVYAPSEQPQLEDGPLRPQGRYGLSKHLMEQLAPHYAHRLDVRVARPFNHLGPGSRPELAIPSLLRRLAADPDRSGPVLMRGLDSVRDFIDVRDVASAYAAILELGPEAPKTFNVCTGRGHSIGDVARAALGLLGLEREVRFEGRPNSADDIPYLVGSPDRLMQAAGWRPEAGLERSLGAMLNAQRVEGLP